MNPAVKKVSAVTVYNITCAWGNFLPVFFPKTWKKRMTVLLKHLLKRIKKKDGGGDKNNLSFISPTLLVFLDQSVRLEKNTLLCNVVI